MEEDILEEKKFNLDSRRWKHRRKMAYIALITGVVVCLSAMAVVGFGSIERVTALSEFGAVFLGILGFLGGIVMAYIGTALVSDVKLWK